MNWIFSGFELSTRVLDQCRLCADSSSFLLPTFMCNSEQLAQLTVHVSLALSSATQLPAVHLVKEKEICSSARRVSCSNANSYRPQGSEWIPVSGSVFASWYPHLVTGIWLSSVMWQIKYLAFFSLLLLFIFFFLQGNTKPTPIFWSSRYCCDSSYVVTPDYQVAHTSCYKFGSCLSKRKRLSAGSLKDHTDKETDIRALSWKLSYCSSF